MLEKQIIDEYKHLQQKYLKIEHEINKKFCLQSLYIGTTSIILENIINIEMISSLGLGLITWLGIRNMFDDNLFFYPIINHSIYKKILNEYQVCIKRIAQTISEANNTNPAFITGIYKSLLNKGYFSYNNQINNIEQTSPFFLIPTTNFGINITNGIYTNKNIAIHFHDILNQLDLSNAILPIFINDDIYKKELEEKSLNKICKLDTFFNHQNAKLFGNRWLNICKGNNDNEVYYIDVLNNNFYKKYNNNSHEYHNKLQTITLLKSNYRLPTKLSYDTIYQLDKNKEDLKKLLKNNSASLSKSYSSYSKGKEYFEQNIDIFEKLYQNNQRSFIEISSNLSMLKKVIINYEEEKRKNSKIKTRK